MEGEAELDSLLEGAKRVTDAVRKPKGLPGMCKLLNVPGTGSWMIFIAFFTVGVGGETVQCREIEGRAFIHTKQN